jgi:heme exporter protein D
MSEFFSQGGYAFFVWSSYGVGIALLVAEMLLLRRDQRTILARLGRLARLHNLSSPKATTSGDTRPSLDAARDVGGQQ